MSVYNQVTEFHFEVDGVGLAIVDNDLDGTGPPWVAIEETRKNGQEDTHMAGSLVWSELPSGEWGWMWEEGRDMFATYGSESLATAIPKFLTANPLPKEMS